MAPVVLLSMVVRLVTPAVVADPARAAVVVAPLPFPLPLPVPLPLPLLSLPLVVVIITGGAVVVPVPFLPLAPLASRPAAGKSSTIFTTNPIVNAQGICLNVDPADVLTVTCMHAQEEAVGSVASLSMP